MPPAVSTNTLQAIAKMTSAFQTMRIGSSHQAMGSVTASEAANCTTWPVRRSNCGTKRFWYSVPAVMASSAIRLSSSGGP